MSRLWNAVKSSEKNGGYVFNTIHNIVPGVSAANVDALARAVRKYNEG